LLEQPATPSACAYCADEHDLIDLVRRQLRIFDGRALTQSIVRFRSGSINSSLLVPLEFPICKCSAWPSFLGDEFFLDANERMERQLLLGGLDRAGARLRLGDDVRGQIDAVLGLELQDDCLKSNSSKVVAADWVSPWLGQDLDHAFLGLDDGHIKKCLRRRDRRPKCGGSSVLLRIVGERGPRSRSLRDADDFEARQLARFTGGAAVGSFVK